MSLLISNLHKGSEELCIGHQIDPGISSAEASVKTRQRGQVDPSVTAVATIAAKKSKTPYAPSGIEMPCGVKSLEWRSCGRLRLASELGDSDELLR
jgi:hypothetical protein